MGEKGDAEGVHGEAKEGVPDAYAEIAQELSGGEEGDQAGESGGFRRGFQERGWSGGFLRQEDRRGVGGLGEGGHA